MTGKIAMKQITMLTLIAISPMAVDAALSVSRGTLIRRSYGPVSLSGITYAGGDDYYAVADNGSVCGLYKVTVKLSSDGKSISSYTVGAKRSLAMAADIEGVAYDPGSGKVWVSDESNQTITEYDPTDGTVCRRVDIPPVLKKIVGNYGFESLTISGDGLTMWTANEEALTCDGDRSSYSAGTTVRLVKFIRETVADDWKLVAMYPYTTDKWTYRYSYGTAGRRGVSDLCALPDGSLLVLERELSSDSAGTGWSAAFGVTLFYSINQVTPAAMAAATDVKDANNGLKAISGWKAVSKITLLRSTEDTTYWSNVEGICLGPRLASGGCELMTLTDAGDGDTNPQLIPHVMSGLSIRTLDFPSPEIGVSTMVGSTYRYLDGTAVQVDLSGTTEDKPYIVDGVPYAFCDGWSASGQTPAEGAGLSASFRVAADGKFVWNVRKESAATGYHVVDSFEGFAEGTTADALDGWSGEDCSVVALPYTPPTPPGYVMTQETHTKVLDATEDEVIRTLPTQMSGDDKIDVMVCVRRSDSELKSLPDDIQIRVASDPQGRLCVWHLYEEGGVWKKGWIPLSETVYPDGEWVRIGIDLDYTSNSSGDTFAKVTVNGSCQPTAHGVRSPTDLRAYGPWHYLAKNRRTGGVSMPSEISFDGTKVDDLMLCKKTVEPEHTGPTSIEEIPFSWFDENGLPRDPDAPAPFLEGYTLRDLHAGNIDPYATEYPGVNVTAAATSYEGFYDGEPHMIGVTYEKPNGSGEATVTYSYDENGVYLPLPEFTPIVNATTNGSVTIYACVSVPKYGSALASATVMIKPRPVALVAGTASKVYDQTPLVCGEWSVKDGGAVVGYGFVGEEGVASLKMTSDSVQTEVGSHANTIDATSIVAKSGTDLANYAVAYEPGLLTVAAGTGVRVAVTPYEGFYDGAAHMVGLEVTKPSGSGEAAVAYSLSPEGPFVPLAEFVQLTDATKDGPVTVYVRATVPNYAAATASATVTIKPRPVALVAGTASKVYDQTPLVCGEWSVKDGGAVVGYGFVGEEGVASLKMTSDSMQTEVGSHANTIDATSIVAKSGTDLANYAITCEPGLLLVTAGAGVNVTATDYEGVYDGREHVVGVNVTKPSGSGEAEVSYSLSPEGPFVSLAEFVQVKNVTKNGPVTVYVQVSVPNYESVRANATVTITPCPVIIRAGSGEKSFDRTPLSVGDYEALGFVDGEGVADLKMVADSTITLPGTRINVIDESSVTFADGTDEDNYDITYQRGELKVLPGMGVGGVDTFEENQEGATADSIENWQGEDASIVLENYDAPTPPGHVTTLATHTRVLDVTGGEAVRIIPEGSEEKEKIDVMVCVQRSSAALEPLPDDVQLRVAVDEEGRLCLWHLYDEGGEWTKGWVPLSEKVYANGEWVRVGIELDYTSNPNGDAFVKVTVNGSCQPTAHGVRSPTDTRAYGPWHYLAKNRRTGGVALPREISFSDTKVDDLMLCKQMVVPEHEGPTSVDGIDFSWFDNAGLPRDPLAAAPFVPGYTLGDIYTAGLDPYTERPLKVTDFCLDASGRPHVEFNGYKGETPVGYQMLYSTTPDFRSPVVLQPADGNFDGDAATWSTMWNGKVSSGDSGAGFYRVKAVR